MRHANNSRGFISIIVFTVVGFLNQQAAFSQCNNSTTWGSATAPTNTTPVTISTCVYQGDYSPIYSVVAGQSYQITNSCAGYVTIRHTTPSGTVVSHGPAPYTFTATVSGTYYVHYNTNAACGTVSGCCTATITCTSCGGGGGCTNGSPFITVAAPTTSTPLSINTCVYQTEYNTITGVVAGQTYQSGSSCGGYITVRQGTYNGTLIAQGNAPLSWSATVNGTYYIHYNTNAACGTATSCCETTITCTSCSVPPPPGCTNLYSDMTIAAPTTNAVTTIGTCTFQDEYNTITGMVAGSTYNFGSSCGGYITISSGTYNGLVVASGNAPLSFTPASSGTYFIHYTSNAACGFIWGCCTTTITCTTCSAPISGPCNNINPINSCNQSLSFTVSGTGTWANYACGWGTPGTEIIYSFTPTASGAHNINISGFSGNFVDISFVNSTSGCSSGAPWVCISDVWNIGSTPTFNLTAGQTYYFLFDPETITGNSVTFSMNCPTGAAITASDCQYAVNICDNANFAIDPNGIGAINEIPVSGSFANPYYSAFSPNPWGTLNAGCLRDGELNSTWMIINISGTGSLGFSFGAGGAQSGYYDWAMWPYNSTTCDAVRNNLIAPVRCNWNGVNNGGTGLANVLPPGGDATNYEPELNVTAGQQYLICFSNYSSTTTSVPLDFFGTATVSCDPLQVEMLNFKGIHVNRQNQLTWMTSAEYNSLKFDIERSIDGVNFIKVGEMPAAGLSSIPTPYQFNDVQAPAKTSFYRLKQWNTVQGYEYSNVINISPNGLSGFGIVSAWPNPAKDFINLNILSPDEGEFEIRITDMQGRIVSLQFVNIASNFTELRIPIIGVNLGMYQITLINLSSGRKESVKVVVE